MNDGKIIDLNVGGVHYTTTTRTLAQYDSILMRMVTDLSDTWPKDTIGRYFIDRDGPIFRYILLFLRNSLDIRALDRVTLRQLRIEVTDYYRIEELRSLICYKPIPGVQNAPHEMWLEYDPGTFSSELRPNPLKIKVADLNQVISVCGSCAFS